MQAAIFTNKLGIGTTTNEPTGTSAQACPRAQDVEREVPTGPTPSDHHHLASRPPCARVSLPSAECDGDEFPGTRRALVPRKGVSSRGFASRRAPAARGAGPAL